MKIESITLKHIVDENPDLSYLGEYSNTPAEHFIDRQERGDMDRNEYRYFNLVCGDVEYIEQDYKRFEAANRGDWCSIGVVAKAEVSYPVDHGNRLETLSSGGLWGIESDSGDYIDEIDNEQLAELREHLRQFGITCSDEDWQVLCERAKSLV